MLVIAYIVGMVSAAVFFMLGYNFGHREYCVENGASPVQTAPIFSRRTVAKKKPVHVSEAEQWKREQKMPPLDPIG